MEKYVFNPDIDLEQQELADLAGIVAHPGFKVIQRICRSVADKFMIPLLNAETDEDVLTKHKYAKLAAQYYTEVLRYINNQIHDYKNTARSTDPPLDVTSDLDIGPYSSREELDLE